MLGADLGLALTYVPLRDRGALAALFAIDRAMGDVVRTTKEPMLGPIRLAWWRERLEELDQATGAPAEPRLQAVERELLSRRISGHDVAALEEGWLRLFDPFPWGIETSEAIWLRGNLLFGLGARVLGDPGEQIQVAGGLWALVDAARAQGYDVVVAAIKEETFPEIESRGASAVHWLSLGELSKLIETFQREGVRRAVMAGSSITPGRKSGF